MPPRFQTAISDVEEGRVVIRGYSHADIIGTVPYADATFLTLVGRLPTASESRLVDAILTSLLDHGWVASTVAATRYIASGNPQFIPAVAGGLLAAGANTLSPEHSFGVIQHALDVKASQGVDAAGAARVVV